MSVSEFYKTLVSAALLGTERQTLPSAQGTVLGPLLPEAENREEALLNAAALASLYLGAGWQAPPSPHPVPQPAPADQNLEPSSAQMQCFIKVLRKDGGHHDLMPELFRYMAKTQVRPIRGWVFSVIHAGHNRPELRPDALTIMDERGRWAAKFLEYGAWVTPSALPESLWDEGNLAERAAFLRELRGRDPGRARELLQESWAGEATDSRATLLEALEVGLSLEDEDFLETCLDDKRKEVRKSASDLLNKLPESKLVARMVERVKPLLTYKPGGVLGLKKASLEVRLPEKFEKDWARDSIEQKNVPYGIGEKAWWLQQMVGRVPPSTWGNVGEIYKAADKDWKELLYDGLLEAIERFRDSKAAGELLESFDLANTRLNRLVPLLAPERIAELTLQQLKLPEPLVEDKTAVILLGFLPEPWSETIQTQLLLRFKGSLEEWSKATYYASAFLRDFALKVPLELGERLEKLIIQLPGQPAKNPEHPLFEVFKEFLAKLEFRRKLARAFAEK